MSMVPGQPSADGLHRAGAPTELPESLSFANSPRRNTTMLLRVASRFSEWIVGHFHEKAGPCQANFFGRAIRTVDCRPTGGIVSLSFVERFFGSAIDIADRRPAGGALCSRFLLQFPSPTRPTSIRTLLVELSRSGASWCSQFVTGAAVSEPN